MLRHWTIQGRAILSVNDFTYEAFNCAFLDKKASARKKLRGGKELRVGF